MWSWFTPKCPVNLRDKVWVERRMHWLITQFGTKPLLDTEAILPTQDFFPDPFSGSEEDARPMLDRVCHYMQTDSTRFELRFFDGDRPKNLQPNPTTLNAAGLYYQSNGLEKAKIEVEKKNLTDPWALVSTLAHEVAHDRLLGEGRVAGNEHDHEPLTDLTPVFFGLGIFPANTAFRTAAWTEINLQYWKWSTLGYLKDNVFGYALAVRSWLRGDTSPRWASYLTTNARSAFWNGLRYLQKCDDRVCDRERILSGAPPPREVRVEDLRSNLDSLRLSSLMSLWDATEASPEHVEAVVENLIHPNPYIQVEAIALLQNQSELSDEATDQLVRLLRVGQDEVQLWAVAVLWQKLPGKVHETRDGLRLPDELIALAANATKSRLLQLLGPLAAYGPKSRQVVKPSLKVLYEYLVAYNADTVWLIELLLEIEPNLEQLVRNEWPDTIFNLFRVAAKETKQYRAQQKSQKRR